MIKAISSLSSLEASIGCLLGVDSSFFSSVAWWPQENRTSGISHPRGSSRTFSLEAPTPVMTTSRAIGETPSFLVYGAEACLPWKLLWAPHGSSILMNLCRSGHNVRMWTLSLHAGGK
jgi:hypothetical protein